MSRKSIAVCKVKWNNTRKACMGKTQQKLKAGMQQHFDVVQTLVLARNWIHTPNALKPKSTTQIHPQPTNAKEQLAASSGKEIHSVQSKLLPPTTASCLPKRELQFSCSNSHAIKIQHTTFINSDNECCGACGRRPRFRRRAKQTTPITNESINDKTDSLTHKGATDFSRCNVCQVDVCLEAL